MKVRVTARFKGKVIETTVMPIEALIERLIDANEVAKCMGIREQLADYNKDSVVRYVEGRSGRRYTVTARKA